MDIVWLGEAAAHERERVGGKAAQLSRLAATQPVPPGFCLPATATPLAAGALADIVGRAYGQLAERCGLAEPPVAVRSSALDEDGARASFAGQHESYLNVVGAAAVTAAVDRCWESLRSERALAYRHLHGLSLEGARLAVLVQQLVPADVSAVLFSANPISRCRDELIITASWGLGESIVGGTVTPDTFTVRKADRAIQQRQIADKRRMTISVPGGTREVEIPRLLRQRPALDDAQVDELARLGMRLEAMLSWPVDVECAYAGGRLYLLQCRPVTTLDPSMAAD